MMLANGEWIMDEKTGMIFACIAVGYVLGNILTAEIVTHLIAGRSAYQMGSGNPGMANVMTQMGKKAGLLVLLGDVLKTAAAMAACFYLAGDVLGRESMLWAGLGTVLGHNYPVWKKFRGGKGVAVTVAWLILYMPKWGIPCSIAGGILTLLTGYLPLGAVLIPLFALPFAFIFEGRLTGWMVAVMLVLMVLRHRQGLARIFRGQEEKKFRKKKEQN